MALIQFVGSWKCKNKEKFMKIAGAKWKYFQLFWLETWTGVIE
jgi:hypothetical protein